MVVSIELLLYWADLQNLEVVVKKARVLNTRVWAYGRSRSSHGSARFEERLEEVVLITGA